MNPAFVCFDFQSSYTCTLGHSSFAIFSKSIFKIIAQGANDTLFYAEFRTVFVFSVCSIDIGAFRFEVMVANKPIF